MSAKTTRLLFGLTAISACFLCSTTTAGLVGCWALDETSGINARDSSGAGFDGRLVGGPRWVPGKIGNALEFDGLDDYVETFYQNNLPAWTICAWVTSPQAPTNTAPTGPVHREKNFQINWNHNDPAFRAAAGMSVAGTWYPASFGFLAANTWYHLAATYDGTALTAYVNGVPVTRNTGPKGNPDVEMATVKLGRHALYTNFFRGSVDDVRIYDSALTAQQLQDIAIRGVAPLGSVTTCLTVDDFESYTDESGREIFSTWLDGFATGLSGSIVGNLIRPFAEQTIVHGGRQSMPMTYGNASSPFYSEAVRTFPAAQNWSTGDTLSLWFRGKASNAAALLYVILQDSTGREKLATHTDSRAVLSEQWLQWQIDLKTFSSAGVNLQSVKKLCLGAGDRLNGKPGGTGVLYIDDITVCPPSTTSGNPTSPSTRGSIVAWGSNAFGQATPPAGKDFVAIAAGSYFSLALRADGSIVGWGKNEHGQATPPAGKGFTAIAAGNFHALALKADGSIVGWGGNDYGESTPPEGTGFTALAAGDSYSLALKSDGSIVGWGLNDRGQSSRPGGNNYIAIAAGRVQSAALRANGTIIVWGVTGWVLEGGYWVLYGRSPTDTDFVAVGVGSTHGLGLKSDGSVEVWGYIDTYPPAVKGLVAIAAGSDHDLALRADGSILAWSRNSSGQATPPAGTGFIALAGGREHSLAIKKE